MAETGNKKNSGRVLKLVGILVLCIVVIWAATRFVGIPGQNRNTANGKSSYTILASNDLGMHCIHQGYSGFCILPPANNIHVQVFKKGWEGADLVTDGIIVEYKINNNTSSADKIDFWKYAADYGFKIKPDQGITGNGLSGVCSLSKDGKYFEATAIPVTPYNDGSKKANPYQTATVTVKDSKTKQVLAVTDKVVIPVSDEMMCSTCHGAANTAENILQTHDKYQHTNLYGDLSNGKRHTCNECHQDNALGAPGKPGIPSLSLAMHDFHTDKIEQSPLENKCYSCHPGPNTKCLRGVMAAAGLTCTNAKCHGSMQNVADTQKAGRQAWLQEPDCANCHGQAHAANKNTLYRNSYLMNGPDEGMDNKILCVSCHNSPHSEWKSTLPADNGLAIELMGKAGYLNQCTACHRASGKIHNSK